MKFQPRNCLLTLCKEGTCPHIIVCVRVCVRACFFFAAESKCGRESVEDDPRPGRLVSVTTQETIDKVHDVILTD